MFHHIYESKFPIYACLVLTRACVYQAFLKSHDVHVNTLTENYRELPINFQVYVHIIDNYALLDKINYILSKI